MLRPFSRLFSSAVATPLKTHYKIADIRAWRLDQIIHNRSVGFVPTMGALHQGHLGLVRRSLEENDSTIVSIFVNPAQFAPTEDLAQYPRTLDSDVAKIKQVLADFPSKQLTVFVPSVEEIYPSGVPLQVSEQVGAFVSVQGLSEQLEGSIRPHFFRGVATVVCKLFNVTQPTRAYFGQKDVQQTVVIRRMVKDLLIPTEIVVCPTVREKTDLAMSSRNEYLSDEGRKEAAILYTALSTGEKLYKKGTLDAATIIDSAKEVFKEFSSSHPDFPVEIEYIALSDKEFLKDLDQIVPGSGAIFSAAIKVPNRNGAETRIIDNVLLD